MNYERKYNEALERAKSFELPEYKNIMVSIFPELAESNDEKNIKDLIDELKYSLEIANKLAALKRAANCQNDACGGGHEKRIALLEWAIVWLEKQVQKPKWTDEDEKKL